MTTHELDTRDRVFERANSARTVFSNSVRSVRNMEAIRRYTLADVDLSLDRGEWLSISRLSGSGKSTLLNIIGCLDRPTSGSYFWME